MRQINASIKNLKRAGRNQDSVGEIDVIFPASPPTMQIVGMIIEMMTKPLKMATYKCMSRFSTAEYNVSNLPHSLHCGADLTAVFDGLCCD